MRFVIISLVVAAAGCNLYYGSDEEASKHKHAPDAGPCCTFDAGVIIDGGGSGSGSGCHIDGGVDLPPDAPFLSDGGYGLPDGFVHPDGGGNGLPDAAWHPDGGYH